MNKKTLIREPRNENKRLTEIAFFFSQQLKEWKTARYRFNDLKKVRTKKITCRENTLQVQFNPARMVSTGAKIDKNSLAERPCFLCAKNRPQEQIFIRLDEKFDLLVNPFPILPMHFTIAAQRHQPQNILPNYTEIHKILSVYDNLTVFYNGPKCGASAPDHLHFQAGVTGLLPLQKEWTRISNSIERLFTLGEDNEIAALSTFICPLFVIYSTSAETDEALFRKLYETLPKKEDESEPMLNIVAWRDCKRYITVVIPREQHRPSFYSAVGDAQFLISPGALDMAGLIITPRETDFERISYQEVEALYKEVGIGSNTFEHIKSRLKKVTAEQDKTDKEKVPDVSVGILSRERIRFKLEKSYTVNGQEVSGEQEVTSSCGKILWKDMLYTELLFRPQAPDASFSIYNVTIGVNFHWEQKETQTFTGQLRITVDGEKLYAINTLPVENYLESVISSEMSATCGIELLKAHAVISRSWLLAQMEKRKMNRIEKEKQISCVQKDDELIRWYDREDHTLFDVCADDHCQRYQGITKTTSKNVTEAVQGTRGEILMSIAGEICDARFSKCCGGMVEEYRYCWEDIDKPYLTALRDTTDEKVDIDLTKEENIKKWIHSSPNAFCNTTNTKVLSQVLNNFDQITKDFYRWHVSYTQEELLQLISSKLKIDFGKILNLIPLQRGKSGRISRLKIVGTKRSFIIGKELEIRRILSSSHLYSSSFIIDLLDLDAAGVPQRFNLIGAGWGHGVGLCQIGAAVMGEKGYTYDAILRHYYSGVLLKKIYE